MPLYMGQDEDPSAMSGASRGVKRTRSELEMEEKIVELQSSLKAKVQEAGEQEREAKRLKTKLDKFTTAAQKTSTECLGFGSRLDYLVVRQEKQLSATETLEDALKQALKQNDDLNAQLVVADQKLSNTRRLETALKQTNRRNDLLNAQLARVDSRNQMAHQHMWKVRQNLYRADRHIQKLRIRLAIVDAEKTTFVDMERRVREERNVALHDTDLFRQALARSEATIQDLEAQLYNATYTPCMLPEETVIDLIDDMVE